MRLDRAAHRRGGGSAIRSSFSTAAAALAFGALAACTLKTPEEPRSRGEVLSVTVTPASARVQPGGTLAFHATVTGTGAVPQGVVWRVECEGCSDDPGGSRIDTAGVYSAPSRAPLETRLVRVSATSTVADAVADVAVVEVPAASVTVTPAQATAYPGDVVQFQARVDGTLDERVDWYTTFGSITQDGLFQVPEQPSGPSTRIVARSPSLDWAVIGEATVTVALRPPVLTATSGAAAPGETLTVFGAGFTVRYGNTRVELLFDDGVGGVLAEVASGVQPDRLLVSVPTGAASGPLRARFVTPGQPDVTSEPIPFERAPRLRVHAARAELGAGETARIEVAFLGAAGPFPLTFEADLGSMTGDEYTAPALLVGPARANVRACVTGTTICSGTTLAIRPFGVSPAPAVVPAGGSLALSAERGGAPPAPTFSIGAGGGTIAPGGLFTAPTGLADSGSTWVLVGDGPEVAPVPVGITGLAPGLVSRAEQDLGAAAAPFRSGIPWGASARAVAISGGRAYVSAEPIGAGGSSWIDVYDLSDPLRPAWLGAVETASPVVQVRVAADRLHVVSQRADRGHRVELFDLSGALPVRAAGVEASRTRPRFPAAPPVVDGARVYTFGDVDPATGGLPLTIHRVAQTPAGVTRTVVLLPPPGADPQWLESFGGGATARDGRAWVGYRSSTREWFVAAWDLEADPPALLGAVMVEGTFAAWLEVRGPILRVTQYRCLDRRPPVPVEVACGFDGIALAEAGSRLVVGSGGAALVDLSDPLAPVLGGTVFAAGFAGALVGDLYYAAEGAGGLAIYDLGPDGGPRRRASAAAGSNDARTITGYAIAGGLLYATGVTSLGAGYAAAWDLGSFPPARVWFTTLAQPGRALALAGDVLLVGHRSGLELYSLADPALPFPLATLPFATTAIAAQGPLAFVGTSPGLTPGEVIVVDLSVPEAPVELGRVSPRPGVAVRAIAPLPEGRLAVALGVAWPAALAPAGDVAVVDVATPEAPSVVSFAGLAEPVSDLAVDGSVALVATATSLVTIDLADPVAPGVLASVPIAPGAEPLDDGAELGPVRQVTLRDGMLWITASSPLDTVRGFDVRTPAWPRLVVHAELDGLRASAEALVIDGPRAYSAGPTSAWTELDLSLPRNVVLEERPAPASPPGASIPY